MATSPEFRVLIASDGSLSATAAVVTARRFPWPDHTRVFGVIASESGAGMDGPRLRASLEKAAKTVAQSTAAALLRRWPDVRVRVAQGSAAAVIVRRAKTLRANVVVMGWRGHGTFRRLLSGSVSREVLRNAPCSVLVVRRALSRWNQIVIGFDGSEQSKRAVAFVARLKPGVDRRVLLVTAAETLQAPSHSLMRADLRRNLANTIARINRARITQARHRLNAAAATLRAAGWKTQVRVTGLDPLRSVLSAVSDTKATLLVVGARSVTGLERVLLGSVAEGAVNRSPVPVLVVR